MKLSIPQFIDGIRAGDRAVLGRAITLVESNRAEHQKLAQELLLALMPETGRAHRVGITGVPGVGKSTFIEAVGMKLTEQGHRVAVLAVDPTSKRSGGSILGDKTRMNALANNPAAFIRPSPSSGTLGGVGRKTRETMFICEAAGFDVILVETVGVGQSETTVVEMVDFFLVLMLAGAGDELQGIKRGVLEMADMLVINKADGDNVDRATQAQADFAHALHFMRPPSPNWSPPVLTCSALHEIGLEAVWDEVGRHRGLMTESGEAATRRSRQLLDWMWSMVDERLAATLRENPSVREIVESVEADVLADRTTPTLGAVRLLTEFGVVS